MADRFKEMSNGTYVYALVEGSRAPSMAGAPPGLAGSGPLRSLPTGQGRWIVAADVPLDRYGEEPLARGLRDLEWVGACALAHEAVVEYLARRGSVVPMKLFTIFRHDARAIEDLAQARRTLDRAFRRIAGASEWSVRAFRASTSRGSAAGKSPPAEALSGADFLRRKKEVRDRSRAAAATAAAAARTAHRALKKIARGAILKPPVDGEAGARLIVDAAYLVPDARRAKFRSEVKRQASRCRAAGCTLTLTGPWPPYHFIA